ncbi:MAG: hypothetical protein JNN15_17850, partial [Blastocatellia bacterium]|nr:hypothetical protein [Blastocatellia bacterium]
LARVANISSRLVNIDINSHQRPSEEILRYIEDSANMLAPLEEILPICRQCPANLNNEESELLGETIGCLGRINYPIDKDFEHFLANRLQLVFDVVDVDHWPRVLHVLIDRESPFDGEATKNLRRVTTPDGLRFFELRFGIKLYRAASHITTDNLFDLLAGFASTDDGASSYPRELPVMALADYMELFEALFDQNLSSEERKRVKTSSRSFNQFLRYIAAVRKADELQSRLLLD